VTTSLTASGTPIAVDALLTPEVLRPARYLGNELGAVHKDWDSAVVRWSLTYPEIYEVGSSNLGHIILYSIINQQPRQLCDRAYLPAPDLSQKLRDTGTPLFAVESRRALREFDILGFSLSYELGATNILEMLTLAGIPITWQERQASIANPEVAATKSSTNGSTSATSPTAQWPLIFAGGQTATSNPEPYADFFDFIALGDGEELLPEIGLIVEEGKQAGLSREAMLLDLAQIPGVYVPQFYQAMADGSVQPTRSDVPPRILRRVAEPMPHYSIGLVPYVETVHDRLTVEIRRGCTRGCRFCQPGMLTRPARDVEPERVIDAIERGIRATGYNEFSLLSLSCSDYLALPALGVEIKNRLQNENISLSLPSQRVDRFDENIANIIGGTRQMSITFAPEAGTQRLRDIINKGLTNEELLRGIKTAWQQGWNKVKLYFMIGLPGETDADVIGIAETLAWLRQECAERGRKPLNFNVTISNFTPKPHTPFQWHSVSMAEFQRKKELLQQAFWDLRGIKANFTDYRISAMEDFVGRGDRRLGPVIKRAWELGAGMDAWWESTEKAFGAWTQAIEEAGLNWQYRQIESGEWNAFEIDETIGGYRLPDLHKPLAWDHVDTGIDKKWLHDDLKKALEAATVPDCSFEGCSHCGVCSVDFGHNVVIPPLPIPAFAGHFKPNTERVQRLRIWHSKTGDMRLVSHLDLLRLFDRAVRRAAIPISFTGGFHPSPRIMPANALSLGFTSDGELVEFELTQTMDVEAFRQALQAQLPDTMQIARVEEVPLKTKAATSLLDRAEYQITVQLHPDGDGDLPNAASNAVQIVDWAGLVAQILAAPEILTDHTTKSGKVYPVNLRERLFSLALLDADAHQARVQYCGSCRNDGTMLRPYEVSIMFEKIAGRSLQLARVHRLGVMLADESH
jgi:radical SAM-linked protein